MARCLVHATHNGWDNKEIAGRLKQLCREFAREGKDLQGVVCLIDDVQGGVIDQADGFAFVEVNSAARAREPEGYPNKRSELWFAAAGRASEGRMDLSRLSEESRGLMRRQLLGPTWKVDSHGRRVVEPKSETKKRLGRSPDDADALNLAYSGEAEWTAALLDEEELAEVVSVARREAEHW